MGFSTTGLIKGLNTYYYWCNYISLITSVDGFLEVKFLFLYLWQYLQQYELTGSGVMDLHTLAILTGSSPRIPLINVKSKWRFPVPLLLVLKLQLCASGEGPLPLTMPLSYTRTTHPPVHTSLHLILLSGLSISYWFSLLLGWPSQVTLFSWNCRILENKRSQNIYTMKSLIPGLESPF